jgi:hypothetical protein
MLLSPSRLFHLQAPSHDGDCLAFLYCLYLRGLVKLLGKTTSILVVVTVDINLHYGFALPDKIDCGRHALFCVSHLVVVNIMSNLHKRPTAGVLKLVVIGENCNGRVKQTTSMGHGIHLHARCSRR